MASTHPFCRSPCLPLFQNRNLFSIHTTCSKVAPSCYATNSTVLTTTSACAPPQPRVPLQSPPSVQARSLRAVVSHRACLLFKIVLNKSPQRASRCHGSGCGHTLSCCCRRDARQYHVYNHSPSSPCERLPHVLLQLQDDGQRVLALRAHALDKLDRVVLELRVLRTEINARREKGGK